MPGMPGMVPQMDPLYGYFSAVAGAVRLHDNLCDYNYYSESSYNSLHRINSNLINKGRSIYGFCLL